jgi:hypothetical protein
MRSIDLLAAGLYEGRQDQKQRVRPFSEAHPHIQSLRRAEAQYLLKRMREPTMEMIDAGFNKMLQAPLGDAKAHEVFTAMIDQMLES